ncbi:hypothetical protein BDV97DRAFT_370088 [Delphinella strobiligena]|nr:hypothetical protein BDV97DRAFT_370088 [Delphinella strobiligena]
MPPRTRATVLREPSVASVAVFETAEMLEQILLHLPMKDLLLASRVCGGWQDTIISSLQIQRALFMKPEPVSCVMRFRPPDRLNKIPENDSTRFWETQKAGHDFRLAYPNPLLVKGPISVWSNLLSRAGTYYSEDISTLPVKNFMKSKSGGSWQRMYLTQPPESSVKHRLASVGSPGGVTMKKIVGSARSYSGNRGGVLNTKGGLDLTLRHTRIVASTGEMAMLHERARGKSSKPWTKEDMFIIPADFEDNDDDDDLDEDEDENEDEDEDEEDEDDDKEENKEEDKDD